MPGLISTGGPATLFRGARLGLAAPQPVPEPAAPPPSKTDRVRGFLMNLFGGQNAEPGLSPEDNALAQRKALQDAGLAILASTGNGQNIFANLGGAALATRGSADQYRRELAMKGQLRRLLSGGVTPEALDAMYSYALESGDTGLANTIVQMRNSLKESRGAGPQAIQVGSDVTMFEPGKGFVNPDFDPTKPEGPGNQHYVESVARGMTKDQLEKNDLDRQLARARIAESQSARAATEARTLSSGFNTRLKGTTDHIISLEQARTTLAEAATGNKAAYGSAIANFVQAVDQKAQLRYQMMQWFTKEIDPTVKGRWDIVRDRLLKGEWPRSVIQGMQTHVSKLLQDNVERYNRSRDAEIGRHPVLDAWLPSLDEILGGYVPGGEGGGGGGNPFLSDEGGGL